MHGTTMIASRPRAGMRPDARIVTNCQWSHWHLGETLEVTVPVPVRALKGPALPGHGPGGAHFPGVYLPVDRTLPSADERVTNFGATAAAPAAS